MPFALTFLVRRISFRSFRATTTRMNLADSLRARRPRESEDRLEKKNICYRKQDAWKINEGASISFTGTTHLVVYILSMEKIYGGSTYHLYFDARPVLKRTKLASRNWIFLIIYIKTYYILVVYQTRSMKLPVGSGSAMSNATEVVRSLVFRSSNYSFPRAKRSSHHSFPRDQHVLYQSIIALANDEMSTRLSSMNLKSTRYQAL